MAGVGGTLSKSPALSCFDLIALFIHPTGDNGARLLSALKVCTFV